MRLLITFFAIVFSFSLKSMIFTSKVSVGDWNNPTSWIITNVSGVNTFPDALDTVIILSGHNIKLTSSPSYARAITINTGGKLTGNNQQLHLRGNFVGNGVVASGINLYFLGSGDFSSAGSFTAPGNIVVRNGSTVKILPGTSISRIGSVFLHTSSGSVKPKVINYGQVTLRRNTSASSGTVIYQTSKASWVNESGSYLQITNDFTKATGVTNAILTASAVANTVVYAEQATTISSVPYSNLHITSLGSTKTLLAPLVCSGDLLVTGVTNTVVAGTKSVTVGGNLVVSGSLVFGTGGFMKFNGNGNTQIVDGISPTIFYDVEINNFGGSVLFNAAKSISNDLIMTAGNCNSNGKLTLKSTPTATARIAEILDVSKVSFTGKMIIQKYIAAMPANINIPQTSYFGLTSPVQNTNVYDWDSEMYISGIDSFPEPISGPGGVDGDIPGFGKSMYTYDAMINDYAPVTGSLTPLQPGVGYALIFADTYKAWYAKTIDTRGVPNYGNVTVSGLDDNFSGLDTWYFIGNPYASHIDYNLVAKNSILNDIYYIDRGNYSAWPNPTIPPHQAFFCVVDPFSSGGFVTFTESCKVNSHTTEFYRTAPNYDIQLTLSSSAAAYSHQNSIAFNPSASLNYDKNLDHIYKPFPAAVAPAIYMLSSDAATGKSKTLIKNSINSLANDVTIPLSIFTPVAGVYYVDASVLNLDTYTYAWYENINTGKVYDIDKALTIDGEAGKTNSDYVLRLSKTKQNTASTKLTDTDLTIFGTENAVNLKTAFYEHSIKEVTLYNMEGKLLLTELNFKVTTADIYQINTTGLAPGIYIVKVLDEQDRVTTKKIVK